MKRMRADEIAGMSDEQFERHWIAMKEAHSKELKPAPWTGRERFMLACMCLQGIGALIAMAVWL
jgi:hypothetical protein